MREQIQVVFENGVFRPLVLVSGQFQEHERLLVTVDDGEEARHWLADADPSVSLESVRQALGKTTKTMAQMIHAERDER